MRFPPVPEPNTFCAFPSLSFRKVICPENEAISENFPRVYGSSMMFPTIVSHQSDLERETTEPEHAMMQLFFSLISKNTHLITAVLSLENATIEHKGK